MDGGYIDDSWMSKQITDRCCLLRRLSRGQLFCDPVDCSPPGSSVRGILQARVLEWVAMHYYRGSSKPRDNSNLMFNFFLEVVCLQ